MQLSYHFVAKIYTAIAQISKLPYLVKVLWLLTRSKDVSGCGYASFDVVILARTLNRTVSTITQAIREATKLGVFYAYKRDGSDFKLSYVAIHKLCAKYQVSNLGAIFEIYSDDCDNLRSHCVRSTIAKRQRASYYLAKKQAKEEETTQPLNFSEIIDAASAMQTGGKNIVWRQGHFLYVRPSFCAYGTSQKSISEILGRTPQTVRKHLKSIKNLVAVRSYQICKYAEVNLKDENSRSGFIKDQALGNTHYRVFHDAIYQDLTNIYDLDSGFLLSQKWLRARVSRYVNKFGDLGYTGSSSTSDSHLQISLLP